jgi:glycosyltransferase involved in cell wall biosynthesis
MKKINICFFLISGGWGGAENVVFNLAKFMQKKGYRINIILNEETYPYFKKLENVNLFNIGPTFKYKKILEDNFHITLPSILSKNYSFTRGLKFFLSPVATRINYLKIRKNVLSKIKEIDPDVIHFHNEIVLQFYKHLLPFLRYPTIYTSHGLIDFRNHYGLFFKLKNYKIRRLLMTFNRITAVSKFVKQNLIYKGVTNPIDVIYNGIDSDLLKNYSETEYNEDFKLIFPGGLKKQKGGEILRHTVIKLWENNYKIKLFYCGSINQNFQQQYKHECIILPGLLPHEEYLQLLSNCECFILLSETEGLPISILEAMGLGKTVITTKVGGIPELIVDGINGFFVKRDPDALAEKILYVYKNPEIRKQISINNLHDIKKYDWNIIVEQYIELYKETTFQE